jgi:hypothetical protein
MRICIKIADERSLDRSKKRSELVIESLGVVIALCVLTLASWQSKESREELVSSLPASLMGYRRALRRQCNGCKPVRPVR